jgi:hypothetical protein
MYRPVVPLGIALVLSCCGSAQAVEDVNESEFELKSERMIVFKDGYCLIVKSGKARTDAAGKAFTDEVPDAAVLGSFWAISETGTLKNLVAGWVDSEREVAKQVDCTQTIEIVEANLGKECRFFVNGEHEVRGTLMKLLGTPQPQPVNEATLVSLNIETFLSSRASTATSTQTIDRTVASSFVVRTNDGDMVVEAASVQRLVIDDMTTTLNRKIKSSTRQKRLSFQFSKANQDVDIKLLYFRPGVRWIPTYRVNLTDQPAPNAGDSAANLLAEVNLQGEILNEAEDLIDVPIDVVVGVPNFRFKSVPSPMVLEATLRNVLVEAAPQVMGRQFSNAAMSNALYTQRSSEVRSSRAVGGPAADVDLPEELSGQGTNDLFVYSLPKMSLQKGERATVPILATKVPYRDIYTWDIELKHAESYAASAADSPSPLVLNTNKVWRQVELVNNTNLPWTTGAAMFVDGFQPLAQELLTYTSPGGICRVPVTVSVDLRGKAEDREVNRQLKTMRWRGHDYAQIQGQITAELANNKDVAVPVEVTIRFGGKAVEATADGKITLESFRQSDWHDNRGDPINNSSKVHWKATVEPGECFEPKIDYEFFVRY